MTHTLTLSNASANLSKGETVTILADDPGPGKVCVVCVNGEPWYSLSKDSRIVLTVSEDSEVSLIIENA